MATDGIEDVVEALSKSVLSLAPDELNGLANLHTQLETIGAWAGADGRPRSAAAAAAAGALVERIVLQECDDPRGSMAVLAETAQSLRRVVREELDDAHAVFPPALDPPEQAPTPGNPPAPSNSGTGQSRLLTGDRDLIAEFVVEANEHLEACDIQLLTLEMKPRDADAIDAVFRGIHTIKGVSGFVGLAEIQSLAHETENLLDQARRGRIVLEGSYLDPIFDAVDMLKQLIGQVREALERNTPLAECPDLPPLIQTLAALAHAEVLSAQADGAHNMTGPDAAMLAALADDGDVPAVGDILLRMGAISPQSLSAALALQAAPTHTADSGGSAAPPRPRIGEVLLKQGEVKARAIAHALRAQKRIRQGGRAPYDAPVAPAPAPARGTSAGAAGATVKVDARRLNRLVDTIGELIAVRARARPTREAEETTDPDLRAHLQQIDEIARDLHETAMELRLVPVRPTFQKMARLVRDVARKTGKQVRFRMHGEAIELDKALVDQISDPLMHMVRNAVGHGLEADGAARRAAGKPTDGTVTLRAYHRGGYIHIEIADDGSGLDRRGILDKARECGLIADRGESLSNDEVWPLILEPGVSTAAHLTEVSGRGVGMDVVQRNIDDLRGTIDILSEPGQGSCFTIRLPLTLAGIDGVILRGGRDYLVVPARAIVAQLQHVPGDGDSIHVEGESLPLLRPHALFHGGGTPDEPAQGTAIIIESGGKRAGLLVDEVIGRQQVVIKPLDRSTLPAKGVVAAAILPDGRAGLLIEPGELPVIARALVPVRPEAAVPGSGPAPGEGPRPV